MLGQGFPHCRKFPTAASRRSLGRVSVPVWPFTLSGRLCIIGLVSRYLTNYLMLRRSIHLCISTLNKERCLSLSYPVLAIVSNSYPSHMGRLPTCYSPVRHSVPKYCVRLACIRHAASVHPEPGSNSPFDLSSQISLAFFLFELMFLLLYLYSELTLFLFSFQRTSLLSLQQLTYITTSFFLSQ